MTTRVRKRQPADTTGRFISEADCKEMHSRLRHALIRLLAVARRVEDLASATRGGGSRGTLEHVEKHVLEVYRDLHVRNWDKYD
jgi:hypothetical protein